MLKLDNFNIYQIFSFYFLIDDFQKIFNKFIFNLDEIIFVLKGFKVFLLF